MNQLYKWKVIKKKSPKPGKKLKNIMNKKYNQTS